MVGVPKEKESKTFNVQCFEKLTPNARMWQTTTEKNRANHILGYATEQTMMHDELDNRCRIDQWNDLMRTKEIVAVTIDFLSWCNTFNEKNTRSIFSQFDQLFGLKHAYSNTHLFPYDCLYLF